MHCFKEDIDTQHISIPQTEIHANGTKGVTGRVLKPTTVLQSRSEFSKMSRKLTNFPSLIRKLNINV